MIDYIIVPEFTIPTSWISKTTLEHHIHVVSSINLDSGEHGYKTSIEQRLSKNLQEAHCYQYSGYWAESKSAKIAICTEQYTKQSESPRKSMVCKEHTPVYQSQLAHR